MILKDIDFASLLYNHQQSQQHYSIGLHTMMTNFGAGSGFSSNISDGVDNRKKMKYRIRKIKMSDVGNTEVK